MSSAGSTKLQYALKHLRMRWEETKEGWSDQVRQDFEEKQLAPIEAQVQSTARAMDKLAEIMIKVRHDCA